MPSSAVVTAKIGPGNTLTTKTFNDVRNFWFNLEAKILTITYGPNYVVVNLDINADTTFTLVLTAGNYVLTVS